MRVAYFDCFAGASGDMLLGALVDGGWALDDLKATFAKIPLGGYAVRAEEVRKGLLRALQVHIDIDEEEHSVERNLDDIVQLLTASSLDQDIVATSKRLFVRLAEVEGRMHGVAPEAVHFHEVGAVDSILDVVGVVAGLNALGIERVVCSPVNVGGSPPIQTRHGWWPIPGPATLDLMKGRPIYAVPDMGETLTPTGALLLSELADEFGPIPAMHVERVGYGAGMRDSAIPNVLRLIIGEDSTADAQGTATVIETTIDDMNPQLYGHVTAQLLAAGALDVTLAPVQMKKGRPGHVLSVLTEAADHAPLLDVIFRETTTIGVRLHRVERIKLERQVEHVETPWGSVRRKVAHWRGKVVNRSPEYDDCVRVATAAQVPVKQVMDYARAASV
ncbi:MAG: nickel pincer cofactor biosynthesis protein LarC [Chloroflexota bacterium]|nr:nickel pincer cofactor biosynthesis protein LarC [Chloroflexota bacterium]MDE2839302.1 nickel pincer cofactor biosynthesis protein LarC [Chloroflexota bacterium]MDE2930793.1 nickel pincer cofactor biosynthesis protein LarC [Chloroflexota bacterium]